MKKIELLQKSFSLSSAVTRDLDKMISMNWMKNPVVGKMMITRVAEKCGTFWRQTGPLFYIVSKTKDYIFAFDVNNGRKYIVKKETLEQMYSTHF